MDLFEWLLSNIIYITCIVSCQGVVQLGVPTSRFVRGGPIKVGAPKSILFTESSCVVKISCYIC